MHREGGALPTQPPASESAPSCSAGVGSKVLSQLSASGSSWKDCCMSLGVNSPSQRVGLQDQKGSQEQVS